MKLFRQNWDLKKNCFVKSPIELAVKIRKNTRNFTSGLKPATLVKNEFCKDFNDSFHNSYYCGTPFGGFLPKKNPTFRQFRRMHCKEIDRLHK